MKTHTVSCMGIPFVIVEDEVLPNGVVALVAPPLEKEPMESLEDWILRCVVLEEKPVRADVALYTPMVKETLREGLVDSMVYRSTT